MNLREYQIDAIKAIEQELQKGMAALVVLPTGCGKSIVIYEILRKFLFLDDSHKAVVLFNRVPLLVEQSQRASQYLGIEVKNYCASINQFDIGPVTFASVHSLKNTDEKFDLVIIDECHVMDDKEGVYTDFLAKQNCKIIGFTATPFRYDGFIYGAGKLWPHVTYSQTLNWAIEQGYLVKPIAKQPKHEFDTADLGIVAGDYSAADIDRLVDNPDLVRMQVQDAMERIQGRKKIVWACANINHAEAVKSVLESVGESVATVHSQQDDYSALDKFKSAERHLTFVTVVAEGFDYPPIDCIVFMRPTLSPRLLVQICGRGLRLHEGKENCLILDYAQVFKSLGTLDNPRIEKATKRSQGKKEKPVKTCPSCDTINSVSFNECENCGHVFVSIVSDTMTTTPDEMTSIIGVDQRKVYTKKVVETRVVDHISKNGNRCKVIEYYGMSGKPVKEYFVTGRSFSMMQFELRLKQIKNISHIVYEYEGKYERIKRVICHDAI